MKAKFVCYNEDSGEMKTVEVSADTLDECEKQALSQTGMRQISRAEIVEGDLDEIMKSPKVRRVDLS